MAPGRCRAPALPRRLVRCRPLPDGLHVLPRPDPGPARDGARRHAGREAIDLLGTCFACGDLDELRVPVAAAGLRVAETRTHPGTVKCPSVDAFVATEVESTPLRERISDEVYGRIRGEAHEILRPFTKGGGAAEIPLEGHVITARR